MMTLNPVLRRAIALSLLLVAILGAYTIFIDPFVSAYSSNAATVTQLQSAIERYRKIVTRLPEMKQTLETLRASQSSQQGYLPGTSEAVAAAVLQDRLKTLIAREGGQLQSTQAMPQTQDPAQPKRVGVRTHMVIRFGELLNVLYRLESETPVLFVENLNIRAVNGNAAEESPLDVNLDIIGYLAEVRQ